MCTPPGMSLEKYSLDFSSLYIPAISEFQGNAGFATMFIKFCFLSDFVFYEIGDEAFIF